MPKKSADSFRVRFEQLLGVRRAGDSLPVGLSEWLESLDAELRDRVADAGLIEQKKRHTLGSLCDAFLESRSNVAEATRIRDREVVNRLLKYFGRDRLLEKITNQDAERWRNDLAESGNLRDSKRSELGDNTVRRRTGVARQIFAKAIKWKMIYENPFEGFAIAVRENLERRAFIPWVNMLRVIDVAPDAEWRAFLAFVRIIGPRVPSELSNLTWADVDLVARKVLIRSPKTKHHGADHAMRSVPLFPEVVPYLEDLAEVVGPGVDVALSSAVFPRLTDPKVNLRTQFKRLIVRAGLEPWEKLFVNLRSSRETELLARYPAADVCRWMGHSPAVAAKFYAQALPEIAERAASEMTCGVGAHMGDIRGELGAQMGDIPNHQESSGNHRKGRETLKKTAFLMAEEGWGGLVKAPPYRPGGTRTIAESQGNKGVQLESGAHMGDIGFAGADELLSLWAILDADERETLLAVARGIVSTKSTKPSEGVPPKPAKPPKSDKRKVNG